MNRRHLLKSLPALAAPGLLPQAALAAGKGRLRSAICAYTFRDQLKDKSMSYDDLVRLCVDLDIDGIDMTVYWFPNTSDEFLLPLKRLAYRSAVEIYSIAVRTEMTQPTPELQQKELADVRKWVDVAEKLGAGHIRVFGGKVPTGVTVDQAAGWVAEVLKPAADYAGKKGIMLGLENHGGVTEKADTIVGIIKKVNSPWVGVNVDTGNFNLNAYQQLETIMPWAVNVQVKAEIKPDASGKAIPSDWERIAKMLIDKGYRGYLSLEYEASDAKTAAPALLRKLREVVHRYSA
jgi:L-ribulose-5-phosphate 3-epimerase